MIKNKEIVQIVELMDKLGENVILEDDSKTKTKVDKTKENKRNFTILVNIMQTNQYKDILFVNFDFTNYFKYIMEESGRHTVNSLLLKLNKFYKENVGNMSNPQVRKEKYVSKHIQYSVKVVKKNPDIGYRVIERFYEAIHRNIDNRLIFSMGIEEIKAEVKKHLNITFFDGAINKMDEVTKKFLGGISRATNKILKILTSGKDTENAELKKEVLATYDTSKVFFAGEGTEAFHELSLGNKLRIIEQAREYGVTPPNFCCSMSMIVSAAPNGFERKFKNETIRPYYIVRPEGEYFTNSEVTQGKSKKERETLNNNPQMFHKAYIEKNKEKQNKEGQKELKFRWITYYDIEQTEPIDPENDIFTNTLGLAGNITGIPNDITRAIMDTIKYNKKVSKGKEITIDNEDNIKKDSQTVINGEKMIDLCNSLGFQKAYEKSGLRLDVDDIQIQAYIAYTAENLAELLFNKQFGNNDANINKESVIKTVAYNILKMFGFDIEKRPLKRMLDDENVKLLTYIVKQAYDEIDIEANKSSDEYGIIGESLNMLLSEV